MKFNKTVAQALANKVRKIVVDYRAQKIREYVPTKEEKEEILKDIQKYFKLKTAFYEASAKMRRGMKSISIYEGDSIDDVYKKIIKALAEANAPKIPTYDELVDDFLIESLDADNSDDLINKVTSKYIA